MSRAAEFRRLAAENEALARMMSRQDHRQSLLEAARRLRAAADDLEAEDADQLSASPTAA